MEENSKAPATLLPALLQRLQLAEPTTTTRETSKQGSEAGWQERVQAIHELRGQHDIHTLMPAFTDPDESVRLAAVQVCAHWGEQAPMQQLLSSLHDPSSLVRQAAIFTLGSLDNDVAKQHIKDAQFDPSPIVQEAVLQMLAQHTESGATSIYNDTTPVTTPRLVADGQTAYISTSSVSDDHDATKNSIEMDRTNATDQSVEIMPLAGKTPHKTNTSMKKKRNWLGGLMAAILLFGLLGSWLVVSYLPNLQTAKDSEIPLWTYSVPVGSNSISWNSDSSQLSFGTQPYALNIYTLANKKLRTYPAVDTAKQMQADKSGAMTDNTSPDTKYLIGTSIDKTKITGQLHIWDNKTGQILASYPYYQPAGYQPANGLYAVATPQLSWSQDNANLATVDGKGNLIVWHAPDGQHPALIFSLKSSHGTFEKVAWSADNKTLAVTTTSGYLEIWNTFTQKMIAAALIGDVQTVTVSPDARYAATGNLSNTMSILDTQSGKVIDHPLTIPYTKADNLVWSRDSRYMILYKDGDGDNKVSTLVWDIAHDKKVFETQSSVQASSVLSPDGHDVAIVSPDDQQINIWEVSTGRKLATHIGKLGPDSFSLLWSPNSKYIASTYQDQQVQLWDAQSGQNITTYAKLKGEVQTLIWSPNGAYMAILTAKRTQVDANSYRISDYNLSIWSVPTH
ncbi:hypothetical protein KDW_12070 [Dictyobacter vulcani]|uniref:Anaphase-promoting complex subunit 4 WD40 domain-containing protein n=1 Tax=Dictyobacter vulcani TaxID=2607529 RepID=A0A5J4KHD5_9CHLR|nr:HEAT repeat domain-containing protein [Dictyobacter vulcani]GER87045.1 hypothetical protein KDW_12070 [Dictyobacter vulcani]